MIIEFSGEPDRVLRAWSCSFGNIVSEHFLGFLQAQLAVLAGGLLASLVDGLAFFLCDEAPVVGATKSNIGLFSVDQTVFTGDGVEEVLGILLSGVFRDLGLFSADAGVEVVAAAFVAAALVTGEFERLVCHTRFLKAQQAVLAGGLLALLVDPVGFLLIHEAPLDGATKSSHGLELVDLAVLTGDLVEEVCLSEALRDLGRFTAAMVGFAAGVLGKLVVGKLAVLTGELLALLEELFGLISSDEFPLDSAFKSSFGLELVDHLVLAGDLEEEVLNGGILRDLGGRAAVEVWLTLSSFSSFFLEVDGRGSDGKKCRCKDLHCLFLVVVVFFIIFINFCDPFIPLDLSGR